jgi:hypothetical protein
MKKLLLSVLLLMSSVAVAQRAGICGETLSASGVGVCSMQVVNAGATVHQLTYTTTGTPGAVSIQIEGSTDGTTFALCGSALTSTTGAGGTCTGVYNKIRANLTSLTGGSSPTVTYSLVTGSPSQIGGIGGTSGNLTPFATSTSGGIPVTFSFTGVDGMSNTMSRMLNDNACNSCSNGLLVYEAFFNGSTWDRPRTQSTTNSAAASQLGVNLTDIPGQWAVFHQPAAATQATIGQSAAASLKHVAKSVTVCISAVAAQPDIIFNLRDGATGAGTIKWTARLSATAGTSQCQSATFTIIGTTNTAMTIESAAAPAATNFATVSFSGYDIP